MNEFMNAIIKMAREVAKEYHGFVEEEGYLFSPSTVALVEEIEEVNRQHLIEQALINGNKKLFMQLTGGE